MIGNEREDDNRIVRTVRACEVTCKRRRELEVALQDTLEGG